MNTPTDMTDLHTPHPQHESAGGGAPGFVTGDASGVGATAETPTVHPLVLPMRHVQDER